MPEKSSGSTITNAALSLSWEQTAVASLRERAAEGMIVGGAIAESLALSRDGLSRWAALRMFGRSPLRFQYVPGLAVPGEHTHSMLMTLQAVFQSRVDHRLFGRALRKRIKIYRGARGLSYLKRSMLSGVWLPGGKGGSHRGFGNPLVRAAGIGLLVQGASNAKPWLEQSNQCSAAGDVSMGPSLLIAHSMQIAQLFDIQELDGLSILHCLSEHCDSPSIKERLGVLIDCLEKRKSVASTAKVLGYADGVPRRLDAIALMSVYAWLRHQNRFRIAVERAVLLGGECAAVANLTGALAGAALGKKSIPPEWRRSLSLFPYNREWVDQMISRIKDWPHGVEDIQAAHSEPSYPVGQVIRNVGLGIFQLIHTAMRIPTIVLPRSRSR